MPDLTTSVLEQNFTKASAMRTLSQWEEDARKAIFTDSGTGNLSPALKDLTKDNYEQAFAKAREELQTIEPLNMYLAAELPEEEMAKILVRLRQDYGPKFLVEVRLDGGLIAGCALAYKGVLKDYSLRARLGENRETLNKELMKTQASDPAKQ